MGFCPLCNIKGDAASLSGHGTLNINNNKPFNKQTNQNTNNKQDSVSPGCCRDEISLLQPQRVWYLRLFGVSGNKEG